MIFQQELELHHSLTDASAIARGHTKNRAELHEGFKLLESWWNNTIEL